MIVDLPRDLVSNIFLADTDAVCKVVSI